MAISRNTTVDMLNRIAAALNVSITDLFEKQERPAQESDIITCPHCNGKIKIEKG
ncbi:MAG: hypothetical protein FWD66_04125 [Paludibacter sp.]|nr:hypothetical protein [Paludibacter sp.]